ncbi:MAG: tetratricopeptide repeat protein [Gemmatimonadetes bacterium]|nr:tetratricopeptide repeat protein [Gemmatimonadota bacterium]
MMRVPPAVRVALACLAVYANSLFNGFAFDDEFIIAGNERVHQLSDQAAIWLTPYWPGFDAEAGLYRPLAVFAYAVQWAIGGGHPWVFHVVNVLLHGAAAALVHRVLCCFTSARAAMAGALLFAVHPVHTEAVANAVGQAELLAGTAVLAVCVLWLRTTTRAGSPVQAATTAHAGLPAPGAQSQSTPAGVIPTSSFSLALVTSVLFAAAMLAKESAVVLPLLLVVLDGARGRWTAHGVRPYLRSIALPVAALAVTGVLYFSLRAQVLGSVLGGDAAPSLPFLRTGQRLFVALQTWPEYARLLVWPFDLSADYSPDVIVPAAGLTPSVLLGAMLLALVVGLACRVHRRPHSGLPAAWFAIAILPVSNLIVPAGVVLAERALYVPSVAIAIAAGFAYERASRAAHAYRGVPIAATAMLSVLIVFGLRSALRNRDWVDTPAYWNALVRDHPESYRAQWGVGAHMAANGEPARARAYLERAVETWPHDPELLNELGLLLLRDGDATPAIAVLERALPLHAVAHDTRLHLAEAYLAAGRAADALAALDRRTERTSNDVHVLRAQALDQLGRFEQAEAAWQAGGASVEPAWARWALAARAFARSGSGAPATSAADSALARAPDPAARATIARLRAAIENACYAAAAQRDDCEDPLAGWLILPAAGVFTTRAGFARAEDAAALSPEPGGRRDRGAS